jgi:putative ABC transport system substrate-binding protein
MPTIGFLNSLSRESWLDNLASFRPGLAETGFTEGQNVTIEYRWAEEHYDRLPALARDLAQRRVDLIAATGGNPATVAARAATTTIPIVFIVAGDPVAQGLVPALNRPGGNMTGVSIVTTPLEAKRLEYLHELVPQANPIAALLNPEFPEFSMQSQVLQTAAGRLGKQLVVLNATSEREIEVALRTALRQDAQALLIGSDPSFYTFREKLVSMPNQFSLPAIYFVREFTTGGGLMSYGASLLTAYQQMGIYSGRILKGEKSAELPVVQPTKFELVINLRTATKLRLSVPQALQVAADEIIE